MKVGEVTMLRWMIEASPFDHVRKVEDMSHMFPRNQKFNQRYFNWKFTNLAGTVRIFDEPPSSKNYRGKHAECESWRIR